MDIIKQFTTSQGKFCVVKIPTEATDIHIGYIERQIEYIINGEYHFIDNLPTTKGTKLELIGLSDEITEEDAKGLVDGKLIGKITYYYSYNLGYYRNLSALESFKSLMIHFECYTENPYGEKSILLQYEGSVNGWFEKAAQWQEAQSKVGRYAVLKEVKS